MKEDYIHAYWKEIYLDLKNQGYSIAKINNIIGTQFSRNIHSGLNMKQSSFRKLEKLYGKPIPHTIIDRYEKFQLVESNELAETIGIILGDGNINRKQMSITLNGVEEKDYILYVRNLLESTFDTDIKIRKTKNPRTTRVFCDKLGIIEELKRLGLKEGDKVRNQVDVPQWIKNNYEYTKYCIKGLFDTDGSAYFSTKKKFKTKAVCLKFTSKTKPLLDFFKKFCDDNDIYSSPSTHDWQIQSRDGVVKFQQITNSEKIKTFLKKHKLPEKDLDRSISFNEIKKYEKKSGLNGI